MKTKRRSFWTKLIRALAGLCFALTMLWHAGVVYGQAPESYQMLDSFSFEATNFSDDFGDLPIAYSNVFIEPGGDGNSLLVDETNALAYLNYPVTEGGDTNIQFNQGSVIFWVAPEWSSTNGGTGPGVEADFITAGSYTTNASVGFWGIYTDPLGQNIYFSGQTNNGNQATFLSYPIAWTTNYWHCVALAYGPTNSTLFLDGVQVTNGSGITYYPGSDVLSNGFWLASDSTGTLQARGLLSYVTTYDTQLNAATIEPLCAMPSIAYNRHIGFSDITGAPSSPAYVPVFDAITGAGYLQVVGTAASCSNGTNFDNIWITNVVATKVVSGTNFTMNLEFTIEGGSANVPYDVFVNSALGSGTNVPPWAWMGQSSQCNTILLTNLPNAACFLILGTPQDSSGSGLTDAYELLVMGISPDGSQTDSYGVPYAWYAEQGIIPATAGMGGQDPDLDGLPNYQEYLYGTRPLTSEGFSVTVSMPNGTTGIP